MNAPVKIDPLVELRAAGLTLTLEGGRLVVTPASSLTDVHRQTLREHRDAIVEALQAEAADVDPLLVDIEALDALILRAAKLEGWSAALLAEVQAARRRMRPVDVAESLAAFREIVRTCNE